MDWDTDTEEKFKQMIGKIPIFLRDIAKEKVSKTAAGLAEKESRPHITEKDLVDAFFEATPFGFHGPMKADMDTLGIDYTQYGHDK
jgi:hypothetical protein